VSEDSVVDGEVAIVLGTGTFADEWVEALVDLECGLSYVDAAEIVEWLAERQLAMWRGRAPS